MESLVEMLTFADAFDKALRTAASISSQSRSTIRVLRDVFGRLSFIVDTVDLADQLAVKADLEKAATELHPFASANTVLAREDFIDAEGLLKDPDWEVISTSDGASRAYVLDRQVYGSDWSRRRRPTDTTHGAHRVAFFSVKGGVGRSTALSMLAIELAKQGKKVLLLDLDLESPGLSSLLLSPDDVPAFGLADWFIWCGVGAVPDLSSLVVNSPVSEEMDGQIRVVCAKGRNDQEYVSKLVRIYSDTPSQDGSSSFSDKLTKLLSQLEAQETPDVVLLDCRGGLHEISAIAISRLADLTLLFCQNSSQSWEGYEALFAHWRKRVHVGRDIRKRLKMVYAMFPESRQSEQLLNFRQKAWDVFRENLYDEVAGSDEKGGLDLFNFSEDDPDAPHYPLLIRWSSRLLEYDPRIREEDSGIDSTLLAASFQSFIQGVCFLLVDEGTNDAS